MKRLMILNFIFLLSCSGNISPSQEPLSDHSSLVLSLPDAGPLLRELLTGYRLLITPADTTCDGPTRIDETHPYARGQTINSRVKKGCDYWVRIEAGSTNPFFFTRRLEEVYLSNADQEGKSFYLSRDKFVQDSEIKIGIVLTATPKGIEKGFTGSGSNVSSSPENNPLSSDYQNVNIDVTLSSEIVSPLTSPDTSSSSSCF